MSTTDRQEVLRHACTCGRGEYVVEHCSPDHPWARGYWYEADIICPECAAKYVLEVREKKVVRVAKTDVLARAKKETEWHAKLREIEEHADSQGHYDALARWLGSFRSVAAAFRATRGLMLTTSEGTFRKRFSPTKEWAKRTISYRELPAALKNVNRTDPVLEDLVKEAETLWNTSRREPAILEAIYN